MFHRLLFIFIYVTAFIFLMNVKADARDLVVNDAGYVIDCSDTEANDGCYEHPECCEGEREDFGDPCIGGDYEECQGSVECTNPEDCE